MKKPKIINITIEKLIENFSITGEVDKSKDDIKNVVQELLLYSINNAALLNDTSKKPKLSQVLHNYFNEAEIDLIKNPTSVIEVNANVMQDIISEFRRLQYHEDTTIGLWAVDRKPKKVSRKWIIENSFRIKKTDTVL